jgi:WD40 repeat protein
MTATTEKEFLPQIEGEFAHSWALVIGISAYTNDITPLHSAASDAGRLASILEQKHGYSVTLLTDAQASKAGLRQALAGLATQVGPQDRLLVYYAGHGQTDQTQDGEEALNLIPQDADRTHTEGWLPYSEVIETLDQLTCRHFLFILDCCFAGSVRGTNMGQAKQRDLMVMPKKLYFERYTRFIKDPAWQVLTSSAADQTSSDAPFDELAGNPEHSPFAEALFTALEGNYPGLVRDDGVITATDLYSYLRDQVETSSMSSNRRQTPQIWPLAKQDKGEYVFLAPGHSPFDLPHNPKLTPENNPYLGLRAFTENEHTLFFGRSSETNYLMLVVRTTPLTIVSGPTGSGKTSLVLAGLLPQLRADTDTPRTILTPVAFGENPFDQLAALDLPAAEKESFLGRVAARWTNDRGPLSARIDAWVSANPGKQLVLVLDQLEALCANNQPGSQAGDAATDLAEALSKHADILRVVGIIRSDALDLFSKVHLTNDSPLTAHWKPENIVPVSGSVSTDRLREMIVGPASERVLFFENDALVNQIANSVAGNPGALPVLSLVLSATYLNYIKRVPIDRTIITTDYDDMSSPLNGTERALLAHADSIYDQLRTAVDNQIGRQHAEQLLLRMVNIDTDPPTLRQVYYSYQPSPKTYFSNNKELDYAGDVYEAMRALLERLISERLVVGGGESKGAYVVPAHVALVQKWDQMAGWLRNAHDDLALQRRLFPSAAQWKSQADAARNRRQRWRATGQLWLEDNSDFERASVTRRARNSWMNQLEREFIDTSQSEQARRKRWRRMSLIATFAVLSVLLVAAIALIVYSNELEQSSRVQRLMFASNNPPTGAAADAPFLLAAEAVVRSASSGVSETLQLQAQQNLRNLLARPEVVSPITSTLGVEEAIFSPTTNAVLLRGTSTARLWSLDSNTIITLADQVKTAHFSPDGKNILTVENDNTAHLRDLDGKELAHFAAGHEINTAIVLAGNQTVLSADFGNTMQQWSLDGQPQGEATQIDEAGNPDAPAIDDVIGSPTQAQAVVLMDSGPAWLWTAGADAVPLEEESDSNLTAENAAFSPDGKLLAVGYNNGKIELWDTAQPEKAPDVLAGHFGWINNLEFSPDGATLLSASADRTARLWSVDGTPIASLNDHTDAVLSAHFSKDGNTIITASTDDTARMWSLDGNAQLVFRHTAPVDEAWCSPDGKYVFSVLTDGSAQLWQAHPYIPGLVRVSENIIENVALTPDSKELLTIGDTTATLWSLSGGKSASFTLNAPILSAEMSRDGARLLVVTDEGPELLDRNGSKLGTLVDSDESMSNAQFSPDGQVIVTSEGYGARIWDRDGKLLTSLLGHEFWVNDAEFSPDGQQIVTASDDHTARVWDRGGKLLATLQGHGGAVERAIFSPDGQHIATLSIDNTVRLWDPTGHELRSLPQGSQPREAVFSPDGKWLAVSTESNSVQLWNLASPETPIALKGHTLPVTVVRFSPDSQSVLTGSDDRTARLWNLQGSEIMLLRGASDSVSGAVFVPGGENNAAVSIITGSFDGALRFYPLEREALLRQAACRVNSKLSTAVLRPLINDITNTSPEFDYSTYSCPLALGQ